MKFAETEVFNLEGAFRGVRNPLESWAKSDSTVMYVSCIPYKYNIGENDLALAQRLIKAGNEHRKFMRQIMVSVDITAPLYWFKEYDTYKVGTTANSSSTMHKLATTPIKIDCFEIGDYKEVRLKPLDTLEADCSYHNHVVENLRFLETLRLKYLETKDISYWKELIRWLPESWLQTRTVTLSYENILSMIHQRKNHKLTEWSVDFINWTKSLPYSEELLYITA